MFATTTQRLNSALAGAATIAKTKRAPLFSAAPVLNLACGGREELLRVHRVDGYQLSFRPTCITRWLPEPMSGLPAAKSGVSNEAPNTVFGAGMLPVLTELEAPDGLAAIG
jgi:hypothetical protein